MKCPKCGANLVIAKKSDVFITVKRGRIYAQPIVEIDIDMQTETVNNVRAVCPECGYILREKKTNEVDNCGQATYKLQRWLDERG